MGWGFGRYKPVFCRIDAKGRQSDPSFGSDGFTMTVNVGPSIKHSRELVTIRVVPETETTDAKLFINDKEVKI